MRIPQHYRKPSWQLFFAGMAIGAVIGWCFFLYIFGVSQEKQAKLIQQQKDELRDYEKEKKLWQDEFQKLNKKNTEQMMLQEIKVRLVNPQKYEFDLLTIYQIEDEVKEDISMLKAKDLDTVYKSRELLQRVIENKVIKVNDKRYRLEIKELFVFTTLSLQLEIHLEK